LPFLAGNRATASRIDAYRAAPGGPRRPAPGTTVQRLELYGRAAGEAAALPAATATEFTRLVEAGSQAEALRMVVDAMTARGELDPRLLRTSGDGGCGGSRIPATYRRRIVPPCRRPR
jgi:hypothetical protein